VSQGRPEDFQKSGLPFWSEVFQNAIKSYNLDQAMQAVKQ